MPRASQLGEGGVEVSAEQVANYILNGLGQGYQGIKSKYRPFEGGRSSGDETQ